jgi:hypothetical protein
VGLLLRTGPLLSATVLVLVSCVDAAVVQPPPTEATPCPAPVGPPRRVPPTPPGPPPATRWQSPTRAADPEQVERARELALASPEWHIALCDLQAQGFAFDLATGYGVVHPDHPDIIGLGVRPVGGFGADILVTVDLAQGEVTGLQYQYADGSELVSVFVHDERRQVRRLPPPTVIIPVSPPPGR